MAATLPEKSLVGSIYSNTLMEESEFSAMPRWLDIVRKTLGQHDIAAVVPGTSS
jgi:hypothetical protein